MKKLLWSLCIFAITFGLLGSAMALSVDLTLTKVDSVGLTAIYRADLTGIVGLSQIGAITITDDGTKIGGADGIFSGFDLDAIFLDKDGSLTTTDDRFFASDFLFSAGTTRDTTDETMLPNTDHPGPTFGSINANTIDLPTATLNDIDAVPVANVNTADGFLTLGDGGALTANFDPAITILSKLYLALGEVGGQDGEFVKASVTVSDQPVPEPASLLLLGTGLVGLAGIRRKMKK